MDVASLGGTASGIFSPLKASLIDSQETISIGKNQSTFAFASSLVPGAAYNVTMTNDAAGQYCTTENLSGTLVAGTNKKLSVECQNTFFSFFGSAGNEQFNGVAAGADGAVIVVGSVSNALSLGQNSPAAAVTSEFSGGGVADIFFAKINTSGYIDWYNYFGTTGVAENASGVSSTPDGGFVIVGTANAGIAASLHGLTPVCAHTGTNSDVVVFKIANTGHLEWYTFLGDATQPQSGLTISAAPDGSIYVLGSTAPLQVCGTNPLNTPSATGDFIVHKISSTGAFLWWQHVGGTGGDTPKSLAASADSGVIVGGNSASFGGMANGAGYVYGCLNSNTAAQDGIIVSLSGSGAPQWCLYFGDGTLSFQLTNVRVATDGSIYVTGEAPVPITNISVTPILAWQGNTDIFAAKISATGTPQWLNYMGTVGASEVSNSILPLNTGGAVVLGQIPTSLAAIQGQTSLTSYTGSSEWFQIKLSSSGALEWWQYLGSSVGDQPYAMAETADKAIVAVGSMGGAISSLKGFTPRQNYNAGTDAFIVKLRTTGGL